MQQEVTAQMLLQDIIDILGDSKGSLNDALLKTKILLYKLDKKDLAVWVTNELQGYPDKNVPEYRLISMEVKGIIGNSGWQPHERIMPIMHLDEKNQEELSVLKCRLSISTVEEAVTKFNKTKDGGKAAGLQMGLPPETYHLFAKPWSHGTHIHKVWGELNMIQVQNILTQVRSRLLEFVLELQGATGEDTDDKEMVQKAEKIDTSGMFSAAVFKGGNNTFIFGDSNNVQVTNKQGDMEGLLEVIRKMGIPEPEVQDLKVAIVSDESVGLVPSVAEGKTGTWFTKTLKAAGDGAYKVGVSVVAGTIVQAIKAHIGIP